MPSDRELGEPIKSYLLGGLSWLVCWKIESQTCDQRTQKGLSLSFGPHHPKVYLWPLVTRLLAKPFSPPASFSYCGSLTVVVGPALHFETRRNQRGKANGPPLLLSLGLSTWQQVGNADSISTRSQGDPCAPLGLRHRCDEDTKKLTGRVHPRNV